MDFPPYQRYQRIVRLLTLLQSGPRHNAGELARDLGVSRRTIYRDINLLRDIGFHVEFHEPSGAYRLTRTDAVPRPQTLNGNEIILIALAAQLSITRTIPHLSQIVEEGISKLLATLPEAQLQQASNLLNGVAADCPADVSPPHDDVLSAVFRAIKEQRQMRIEYAPGAPEESWTSKISPYQVEAAPRAWSLTARSSLHRRVVTIDLHGVRRALVMEDTFVPPTGWSRRVVRRQDMAHRLAGEERSD